MIPKKEKWVKVPFYRVFVEKAAQLSLLEDKSVTKQNLLAKVFNVEETTVSLPRKRRQQKFVRPKKPLD